MAGRITRREYGVIHAIVVCKDCGWETFYKNGQALAAKHAKHHGHHVEGELGIAFSYTGQKEATDETEKEKISD